jgi:hypothetical protein
LIGDSLQNDTTKKYSYNKTLGRELGSCVVHALNNDLPPGEENLLNSVALMRGTSMVVQYMKISESLPVCVGVFKAADEIDDILRMSENPAHVHWDWNSTRLSSEEERSIVKTILKRTKENFKKFQKELAPSHSSKILAINEIANALASYLRPQIGSNKMPPGSPRSPIHIAFLNQPSPPVVTKKGDLRIDCKFQVSIDEKCPYEKLKMYVRINSPIIEQGEASKDRLAFKMSVTDIEKPSEYCGDATDELTFILEKKRSVTIRAVSEDYDRDWEIRVEPELRGETI